MLQVCKYALNDFSSQSNPMSERSRTWTLWRWTYCSFKKFQNAIFREILKNPSKGLLQLLQNLTNFFIFKISQQIWLLEASKVSAKMGRGWQADWATAKIFMSNLHKHVMNNCWKFQADISIHIWFRAKWLKNCCNNRPTLGNHKSGLPRVGHWSHKF